MEKKPFVTKSQVEEIVKTYPTPFHLYDEKGICENAKKVKEAFAWNPGFREYFAVKATPNPYILKILQEYDMGCDCSSYTELTLAKSVDLTESILCFLQMIRRQRNLPMRMNSGQSSIWMISPILIS